MRENIFLMLAILAALGVVMLGGALIEGNVSAPVLLALATCSWRRVAFTGWARGLRPAGGGHGGMRAAPWGLPDPRQGCVQPEAAAPDIDRSQSGRGTGHPPLLWRRAGNPLTAAAKYVSICNALSNAYGGHWGEVSEWFKEPVLKTGDPQGPWVRIPPSPPFYN